ncbi:TetR/AcrR family transcriptional regulator (plasmid) [Massilia varians]
MASAYERHKDPIAVRRALLDCATSIAANEGMAAVTVAGVSTAAGVTKGALFHHFSNKQALLDAMVDELMTALDDAFDALMAADKVRRGSFTRAYVQAALTMDDSTRRIWSALLGSLITESAIAVRWQRWLEQRLLRHAETDSEDSLRIVRLAADGAWFSCLSSRVVTPSHDLAKVRTLLIDMTL